jgi:hypothetical protein
MPGSFRRLRRGLQLAWKLPKFYSSLRWRGRFRHQRNSEPAEQTTVQKLVLMSVIFASIIIPARAARVKSARAGLKRVIVQMTIFNLFYLFLVLYVVGRL